MRELVTEESDAIDGGDWGIWRTVQLVVETIAADSATIVNQIFLWHDFVACHIIFVEIVGTRLRPEIVVGIAADTLRIAGVDDVNQIYELVAIVIISREINLVGSSLGASLADHLLEILVVTLRVIRSVIGRFLADGIWTYDVELWGEFAHAAFLEILLYRTVVNIFLVEYRSILARYCCAEIGIEVMVESGNGIAALELHVLEIYQDNQRLGRS